MTDDETPKKKARKKASYLCVRGVKVKTAAGEVSLAPGDVTRDIPDRSAGWLQANGYIKKEDD